MSNPEIYIFGIGSGIGKALWELVSKNHGGVAFGFSRKGIHQLGSPILGTKQTFIWDAHSESDYQSFSHFFETRMKSSPNLTSAGILVYFCQGDGQFFPASQQSAELWQPHFQLNVFSILHLAQIFGKFLPNLAPSSFVFLGSTASRLGFQNSSLYCASKHAVFGIAKALREEWKPFGTKCLHIGLGAVATEIWEGRSGFSRQDMISVEEIAEYLFSLSLLPKSVYLDEIWLTPRKGIL